MNMLPQVHTLASAADNVRRVLVQVGAKEAVTRAKIKFGNDSFVTVAKFPCPLLLRTLHGKARLSTYKMENIS